MLAMEILGDPLIPHKIAQGLQEIFRGSGTQTPVPQEPCILLQCGERSYTVTDEDLGSLICYQLFNWWDIFLQCGERSYTVALAENGFHCDCATFTTTHLPRPHIFRVMEVLKLAFQADSIPQRWSKAHTKLMAAQPVPPEQFSVTRVERKTKMIRTEKFKELSRVLRDIVSMCCDLGHRNFCQRYDVIVNLHKAW